MRPTVSSHVKRWRTAALAVLLIAVVALFWGRVPSASAGTPTYPCDNERLGFGVVSGIQHYDVTPLRGGWYVNWGAAAAAPHPAGMDFAQIIRTNNYGYWPAGAELADIIARNPGALWLISNEPDSPAQDNTMPEPYATVYHKAYNDIKSLDPAAQVAIGGIIGATPVRMKWLDMVWEAYQRLYGAPMPVDVWNVHAFVLREARRGYSAVCAPPGAKEKGDWGAGIPPGVSDNCGQWIEIDELDRHDLFQEQIVRFRTWMRDHGQQNKELVVSEYGILFPEELGYTYPRVKDYMLWTFNYFATARDPEIGFPGDDHHLVQRWAWYSLDDNNFGWGITRSALMTAYDPDRPTVVPQLTQLGNDFAQYASAKLAVCPSYVDLRPVQLQITPAATIPYGAPTTLGVKVEVQNRGNAQSPSSEVRLYDGAPDAGGTLLATLPLAPVPARYQGSVTVSWDWTLNAAGSHTLTAVVDPANQVPESRKDNNVLATAVDFGTMNLAVGAVNWRLDYGPLRPGEATQITLLPAPVTVTQPELSTPGLNIVPPAYLASWYDGDPSAGGQLIASQPMIPPATFGVTQMTPAQAWAPVVTGPRTAWLVISIPSGAPETSLADNRARTDIPATTDLILTQVQQAFGDLATASSPLMSVRLRFRVGNQGTRAPGTPLEVSLRAGTTVDGPEIGRGALASSGDWTNYIPWSDLEQGSHPYVAVLDPDNVIPEGQENNNVWFGHVLVTDIRVYLPLIRR
jgi:hypothetical protein